MPFELRMSSSNHIPLTTKGDFVASNQTSDVYNAEPLVSILRFICEVCVSLPLSILGVVGNLLSLYILSLYSKKKLQIILILLRMLSVVDTLVLLFNLHLRSLRYIFTKGYFVVMHAYTYPVIHPFIYILRMINTWLLVLLTVDRYLAVCKPLHAYALSSVRRTYFCLVGVVTFSALFCLPRFFESHTKNEKDGRYGYKNTSFFDDPTYTVVYRIFLFICFQYLVPGAILTCINTKVILLLRASDTFRKNHLTPNTPQVAPPKYLRKCRTEWDIRISVNTKAPAHVNRSAFQSTRNITIVVAIVVMISIVCLVVNMTAHIMYCLEARFKEHPVMGSLNFITSRRVAAQLSNVLVTFNSASNFIIYCFCSKNFRTLLSSCLCRKLFCMKSRGRSINTEIEWEQYWRMRFVRRTN